MHLLTRLFVLLILCSLSFAAQAQNLISTKYFDSSWAKTSKESAFYYTDNFSEGSRYKSTTYWMRSKSLQNKSSFSDSIFLNHVGLSMDYYEDGQVEDSTNYHDDGTIKNAHHYHPNGKILVRYTYNNKSKKESTEAFDLKGERIEDFIYANEASFKDGGAGWIDYLGEKIKTDIPIKNKAPLGTYKVVVKFMVNTDGKILNAVAETNHGYGMEEEVIRVITKSPKWNPAIFLGKKVKAYRRQPLTFIVEKE